MDNTNIGNDEIHVDELKAKIMLMRIINAEQENINTKEYTEAAMVSKIKKIIEEEYKCN